MRDHADAGVRQHVGPDSDRRLEPGKRTRSQGLPVQRRIEGPVAPVIAPTAGATAGADPFWFASAPVQDVAAEGVVGASAPLPHLDTIQRSFGRHDVGAVQAQIGGSGAEAAARLGAAAYATGSRVAFAGAPDLHTAAHEAAHVVQQRGGVQLQGGLGEAGDVYERHADEVADAVVAGASVEHLLDRHGGGDGATAAGTGVQRLLRVEDVNDGQPYVEGAIAPPRLTPAEAGVFRRWIADETPRRYDDVPALAAALRRVASQPFGTDIALEYPTAEAQQQMFKQALHAGYRVFDTAFTYNTLENLWAAVQALEIPRDELTIIYKVKPSDDDALEREAVAQPPKRKQLDQAKLTSRLDDSGRAMGGASTPDVLMLHDLVAEPDVVAGNLRALAARVVDGDATAIGVSNATVFDLDVLCPIAADAGAPITYVQNQCSPYHRDDDVRRYCVAHDIQYLAYGMMGSAQIGECAGIGNEGDGLPTQYLLARHDPRLQALALESGISEGELLLGWAQQRGIAPVTFTSRPDQAKKNFERAATPLSAQQLQQLDEMFVAPSQANRERVEQIEPLSLRALYRAWEDPTAWSILDELRRANGGDALLTRLGDAVIEAHPEPDDAAVAMKELVLNLMRHVADLQSVIQLMQKDRARIIKANQQAELEMRQPQQVPLVAFTDWREKLVPAFEALAQAAGAPQVFDALHVWATRDPLQGGTMAHAEDAWRDIGRTPALDQPPVVGQPPVAQLEAQTVDVSYDSDELLNGSALEFDKEEDRAALGQGAVVCYQWKQHQVVSNQVKARTLTLRLV